MTFEKRIAETVHSHIETGDLPGAAWWVCSGGQVARGAAGTFGPQDERLISPDTVFRVSSMTKPVVAAAAMTLIDDGTLELEEPIDGLLPELANRRVLADAAGPLTDTVPARRPILLRDLLEFRLGLGMDFTGPWPGPVLTALAEAGLAVGPPAPQQNPAPDKWIRLLGTVPLAYQPGEHWLYHTGASVLGLLIARATGGSLPAVLDERILTPLGMRSTGFGVSAGTRDRFGPHWTPGADGAPPQLYDAAEGQWSRPPAFPDGGDGLVSTVDDYAAFAVMLSSGGVAADGRRVLSEAAVTSMTTDQVGPVDDEGGGWGLGMGVRRINEPGRRHAGSYGWDGGLGSSWWTDPVSGVTAILLTNQMWTSPQPPAVVTDFWAAAFGQG